MGGCPVSAISWEQPDGEEVMSDTDIAEDPSVDTMPGEVDVG
jgi:hypothetical protein